MSIKTYEITMMEISALEENELNPRTIAPTNFMALRESLNEHGNLGVILYNKRTGHVVSGNQRLKVLRAAGETQAPTIVLDIDQEEEIGIMIQMNNEQSMGSWVGAKVLEQIDMLKQKRPELYDKLNLLHLRAQIVKDMPKEPHLALEQSVPEMEIMPYEHWDYLMLVFKDSRDWVSALEFFGVKKAQYSCPKGQKKTGLARVMDGARIMEMLREKIEGRNHKPEKK
jgi:hypothetical protein